MCCHVVIVVFLFFFFFFNDTATTEIYTLSLHDALPIYSRSSTRCLARNVTVVSCSRRAVRVCCDRSAAGRSEEHTSELQSLAYLVCRLLLEKKKNKLKRQHENNTLYKDTNISVRTQSRH